MGLAKGSISFLLEEKKRRPFSGYALTLGRLGVSVTYPMLTKLFDKFGFSYTNRKKDGFVTDYDLFTALGFSCLESMDLSDYEGATIIFDLNSPDTPTNLIDRYDIIIDGGTIEHVFHLPNVFANIFRMLKVGGRIIHLSPSSGHIEHGFYMFSPTLFTDFYNTNNFRIESCELWRYDSIKPKKKWDVFDYTPDLCRAIKTDYLDKKAYGITMIATKLTQSSYRLIPQQSSYLQIWGGIQITPRYNNIIKKTLQMYPTLYNLTYRFDRLLRKKVYQTKKKILKIVFRNPFGIRPKVRY